MTKAQTYLERPVKFVTAVKKLAAIRGDEGRAGGWIYNRYGYPVAHGWESYGAKLVQLGLLCQDEEHGGGNGKWYVWVIGLTSAELVRAEQLYGEEQAA